MRNLFPHPFVVELRQPGAPLVVLLHGRGSDASDIISIADYLPRQYAYAALRAPIAQGGGYAWFENRGIGRPVSESLAETMAWFDAWLSQYRQADQPVLLVGFSGGAAFAGGLLLTHPSRYAGCAILSGTLPFEAGLLSEPGQLDGAHVFVSRGRHDTIIPQELLDRTWAYLTEGSGAITTSQLEDAGHELTGSTLDALSAWLTSELTLLRKVGLRHR